jgi:hypothetical protein
MRWALFARLGERLARLRKRRRPPGDGADGTSEFSAEELAEFLEGDLHPNDARPEFREKLREEMWELVQQTTRAKEENGTG